MIKTIHKRLLSITASSVLVGMMFAAGLSPAMADPGSSDPLHEDGISEETTETVIEADELQEALETKDSDPLVFHGSASTTAAKIKFKDVNKSTIFYNEITQLADYGVTEGWKNKDGSRRYEPLSEVKRDAVIVFLYRAMGSPEYTAPKKSPFADVKTNNVFYKEIAWAHDTGISTGWKMKDGTRQFRPHQNVKRDAMAAFLMRASGDKAPSYKKAFKDVSANTVFAAEIQWMKDKGISTGWANGTYQPLSNTKRDAMAAFMIRWLDKTPPSTSKTRKATVKEQEDWTSYLPSACQKIEIRNFRITNPSKKSASFNASVTYDKNGEMYYSLSIDGNLPYYSAPAKALMKHECGHVLMGIYSDTKGRSAFRAELDKGWPASNTLRVENAADCIADELGAIRQTSSYKVGYGTKCSSAQKNVAKTITNYSKNR